MSEHPARAVIDLTALSHNLDVVKGQIGCRRRLLAVVKANAYGHGATAVARHLQKIGADMLGVACAEEGILLRQNGICLPILVMGCVLPSQIEAALEHDLTLNISRVDIARGISDAATRIGKQATVHIKIDTGMGRLGLRYEDSLEEIAQIRPLPALTIEGIFTHLSSSEVEDPVHTAYQTKRFQGILDSLIVQGMRIPIVHMANSGAVIQHPETYFDMVRVGIMMYGVAPTVELQKRVALSPVLSLKTRIVHIRKAEKGSGLSYGRTYICPDDKRIAVIPAGYSDGLARCMTRKIQVLIGGVRVPVVGSICMDMSLVDITGLNDAKIGDEVVLIGTQGRERVTAHDWARWQDTIPYEVLCAIGPRVLRVYHTEDMQPFSVETKGTEIC